MQATTTQPTSRCTRKQQAESPATAAGTDQHQLAYPGNGIIYFTDLYSPRSMPCTPGAPCSLTATGTAPGPAHPPCPAHQCSRSIALKLSLAFRSSRRCPSLSLSRSSFSRASIFLHISCHTSSRSTLLHASHASEPSNRRLTCGRAAAGKGDGKGGERAGSRWGLRLNLQ